jgi:hypothetical protein
VEAFQHAHCDWVETALEEDKVTRQTHWSESIAVVRKHAKIPDDMVIMTCIAMGYPNHDFAANRVKLRRTPARTS